MSSLETTELKLKTTPTGGAEAHVSPYYRRLVSAGYKGFLQGTLGGASLYGVLGSVVGGLVAVPLLITGVAPGVALAIVTAGAGLGLVKGATTFGNIGSVAAINAESADLSEQRRYLLDRYYDLPEGPEGDKEAAAIRDELMRRSQDTERPPFFHWKTVAMGALIGAAVVGAAILLGPAIGSAQAVIATVHSAIGVTLELSTAEALFGLGKLGMAAIGSFAGAIAGATIGIDRYYIRKWFDHTQDVVHSSSHSESALLERQQQVQRIKEAAKEDAKTRQNMTHAATALEPTPTLPTSDIKPVAIAKPAPAPTAPLDKPSTKVAASDATLQKRVVELQKVLEM